MSVCFSAWSTVQGNLFRTVGATEQGPLADKNISRLFNHVHVSNISLPLANYKDFEDIFEETHNRVHRWVGGEMRLIETAAQDPVFYIYHPFIDYIWQTFREHQRENGVDPETDWDLHYGQARHHMYSPMGLGNLMALDGANEIFAENIRYTQRPMCSRQQTDCYTPLLYCNITVEKCVPWTIQEYKKIKRMADIKFRSFELEAKEAIKEKIMEGKEELNPKTTTTTTVVPETTETSSKPDSDDHHHDHDHDHTKEDSSDDQDGMTGVHDHSQHKHADHLTSILKDYLSMMILAGLLVLRILLCICCKCCSEKKVKVKRTSRKYKVKGIVNVNYNEDNNKPGDGQTGENRPDNIYTITETLPDTSTLGQSTYVRFSKYIVGSKNDNETDNYNVERAKRANVKYDDYELETGHRYRKNKNKGAASNNRYNKKREDSSDAEPDNDSVGDYMDMTYATQVSQSDDQINNDMFETETNASDTDTVEDANSVQLERFNSVENENFELPVRATEDSFAFLDDYDNIDFIREAMNHDIILGEECQGCDKVDEHITSECTEKECTEV